jgi:hypothetical protein
MKIGPDDPVLKFLWEETEGVVYPEGAGASNVGAGELAGESAFVINPSGVSRIAYPSIWKIGCYRTDNNGGMGSPNAGSTRPFPIAKYSEFYFIAAEAAVKGATTASGKTAYDLINVIRARAGKWSYCNAENAARNDDFSADLVAATPKTITVDYILDERLREYYGEGQRWFELVRTQTWAERAATFTICGSSWGDHTKINGKRDIQNYLYLRPIPTGQLDGMEMTDTERAIYQNPGY